MDKLLQNEIFVRVFAVVVAVLIFIQAQGASTGTLQRTIVGVPVQIVGLPSNMVAVGVNPDTVSVTVSGPSNLIIGLDTSKVGASVNLAGATSGRHTYFAQVTVPPGVELVTYNPVQINVTAELLEDQEKPVTATTEDTPAAGFGVSGDILVVPKVVVVHGAASAVAKVVDTTVTVSVAQARANVTEQAQPVPVDAQGKPVPGVTVLPSQVQVTVPIEPDVPQKAVPVQPAITGQPAAGYTVTGVTASPQSVLALGSDGVLAGVDLVHTQPIPVDGASTSIKEQALIVEPSGVVAVDPTSVTVTVTISKGAAKSG